MLILIQINNGTITKKQNLLKQFKNLKANKMKQIKFSLEKVIMSK